MADDFNFNPYTAPQASSSAPPIAEQGGLKSLGQEARKSSLNKARWIMIVIGIITIAYNLFEYSRLDEDIRKELKKQNLVANAQQMEEIKSYARMFLYVFLGLGALFVVMGIIVNQFPVPITIAALVLYVGGQAFTAYLNPATLAQGWLIKILFIAGLWQAIQAAFAYEKERRMAPYGEF